MKWYSSDTRLALVLSAAPVTLVFRLVQADGEDLSAVGLGWLLGLCAWLWLWQLCSRLEGQGALTRAGRVLFFALFVPMLVLELAYTYFLETSLERRLSLLDVGGAGVAYFFEHVLPPSGLFLMLALVALIVAASVFLRQRAHAWPALRSPRLGAGLTVLFAAGAVPADRVAHPLADVCADLEELVTTPHVEPSATLPARFADVRLDRSHEPWPTTLETPFDRVLVFVLESITAQNWDRERRELSEQTFARAAEPHVHSYTRYFTGNQDSRTGMLGMLSSRVNPLEAYTDLDVAGYRKLVHGNSLVQRMNRLGYATAFAVSQLELELVVEDLPWQARLNLSETERKIADERFECLTPYEFEHSCEDLALLPKVLDWLDQHPRAFLYQEFIWGHSWHYNAALKQSNAQYYSAYIDAVLAHLGARGELERTLVVVVSDHGPREYDRTRDLETYRIPLWVYNPRFAPRSDGRLLSHLDFAQILLSELSPGSAAPAQNPFVLITGPTSSSLWAAVTDAQDFMLVKSRGNVHLRLEHAGFRDGRTGPPADASMIGAIVRAREDYRRAFLSAPN